MIVHRTRSLAGKWGGWSQWIEDDELDILPHVQALLHNGLGITQVAFKWSGWTYVFREVKDGGS